MCARPWRWPAPAPVRVADAEQPLNLLWLYCTYRLGNSCSILAAFQPNPAFLVNYIITTCFSSLLPSLLLIRPSLLHSLLHCYYIIITHYYGNNLSIITHYYIRNYLIITPRLIFTSVITSLLSIITKSLLPIIAVTMDLLLPIITRSIIGNNGSIFTYY